MRSRSSSVCSAKRAGHAGTLDPLASGCLPIALGEATKTVPFVVDGRKTIASRCAGARSATPTMPKAGSWLTQRKPARCRRDSRPAAALYRHHRAGAAAFLRDQDRRRARLRSGARRRNGRTGAASVEIHRLDLVDMPDPDHAVLAAECGKGTYVRALARDIGRALGVFGHVSALRRTGSGRSAKPT
jgi:tRNA pseudouridine55 synthase